MLKIHSISAIAELNQKLSENNLVIVFKHSTRCSISSRAYEQFQTFAAAASRGVLLYVDVIASRILSNEIAETFGVLHQSPQILFFKDGKVVWHASHSSITTQRIVEEVAKIELEA